MVLPVFVIIYPLIIFFGMYCDSQISSFEICDWLIM